MFVEIRRHFKLNHTNREKKYAEANTERCGAIDTSNDSGKGNEQCEAPGSDFAVVSNAGSLLIGLATYFMKAVCRVEVCER
eukprot:scaffold1310_cov102-Skeletonema_marinoi.AAC.1